MRLLSRLLVCIGACRHPRTTFPLTPRRQGNFAIGSTYVVCLDCGKEFAYSWDDMKRGEAHGQRPLDISALKRESTEREGTA
jgi:hypothetical protein